jgi:5'-deoxynucleotidase YfbR-like HD superfamily hydrolase
VISAAVSEYEAGETPEAIFARDADKLECLLQAREYQDQGHQNPAALDRLLAREPAHRDSETTRQ